MLSKYNIVTLFPNLIEAWLETGIISKAHDNDLFNISTTDLREYGLGDYRQVDDAPYGGGPGMVLMPEPLDNAISSVTSDINIFLTPSGKQLDEPLIEELHTFKSANIICGRYEGFDQRIIDIHSDYQISVGKTVVSGGEVPAMFLLEAMIRKIPGALGNSESLLTESFTDGKLDHPVYTRPEIYKNMEVPEVLLSGNHKKIEEWKKNNLRDI
ncbi:MAG: tRNA (guanosine(37)-N1)-methyltransferase TrmD [Candidatus Actinomarina sp.]|jgi:tRNA (guanine37-N1)-methyltransferase|nr:tRNA (guanosine(37)-N1)-methyltransferase TrmD [Actinomycetota bacterium]MBL6832890.1 tRNA (guanosine(37)-N1)-methyltransferase TrmD [Candidatus Actinomarina sp.]MBL6837036.1 tRNA (guanosine(37)-N1)-methyltransferase TrmD [Candidatus Actinomarina sp.]MDB2326520.1 tRNA (guanosine(37)-N1)-methyltransferase TrmD [Candidatus Actinomarina sp.]MDB4823807.1 tRNA (guanosine(37)-N1)-methyltransferase TrmD [Acidimicrobiia bacterium]